jgi:hypothetical protein
MEGDQSGAVKHEEKNDSTESVDWPSAKKQKFQKLKPPVRTVRRP